MDPLPVCVANADGQPASQLVLLTTPGQSTSTLLFVNNGTQAINADNVTWTAAAPGGFRALYAFDGKAPASSVQQAWQNRMDQLGTLRGGQVTRLTVTYTSPAGLSRGDTAQGSVTVTPNNTVCPPAQQNQTLTIVKADPGVQKTQAVCRVTSDGSALECGPSTAAPVELRPCEVLRYTLTGTNSGDGPLLRPMLRDALQVDLLLQRAEARSSKGTPLLYSVNGGTFGALPTALASVRDIRAAPDSNRDGMIDNRDAQQPGEVLTLVLDTALKGPCPAGR